MSKVQSPRHLIEVAVRINGIEQPLRFSRQHKYYVAGTPGTYYELSVRNLTGSRIEVLSTVDGRNTLKDEVGDIYANRGMVINPNGTWDVVGFRLDDSNVRRFVFGTPAGSIAEQATGSIANVGVIGFAVYEERNWGAFYGAWRSQPIKPAAPEGAFGRSAVASAASAATFDYASEASSLGTHMGEQQHDPVGRTTFEREGAPDILVIGYDTYEKLKEQGIIDPRPDPFPGSKNPTGYEHYRVD